MTRLRQQLHLQQNRQQNPPRLLLPGQAVDMQAQRPLLTPRPQRPLVHPRRQLFILPRRSLLATPVPLQLPEGPRQQVEA